MSPNSPVFERVDGRLRESVALVARFRQAENGDQRRLVAVGVLAGALSQSLFVAFCIENIVGHLERRAERRAESAERRFLRSIRAADNRAGLDRVMQQRAGLHRLHQRNKAFAVRLLAALGFEIERLAADHATKPRGAGQHDCQFRAHRRIFMRRRVGNNVKCIGEQTIAGQNGHGFVKGFVHRRPAAAQIVIVHRWKIVMDQRIAMNHLKRTSRAKNAFILPPEQPSRLD